MAYEFDANNPEKSFSTSEVQQHYNRYDTANHTTVNNSLWIDGYQAYGQIMSDNRFNALLKALDDAVPDSNSPANPKLKLVLRMAIGGQMRLRPFIGITTDGSDPTTWWDFDVNLAQGGGRTPIEAGTASDFEDGLLVVAKADLHQEFSYIPEGETDRTFVRTYTYDNADTLEIHTKAMQSSFGEVKFYLFFGAGAYDSEKDANPHPMNFRPILDLKVNQNDGSKESSYWDFSTPCPPNCAGGN